MKEVLSGYLIDSSLSLTVCDRLYPENLKASDGDPSSYSRSNFDTNSDFFLPPCFRNFVKSAGMELSVSNLLAIYTLLSNSLSGDEALRKPAESTLAQSENLPGFSSCLMEVITSKDLVSQRMFV
ncbi:Armadillo-like helical [Cynara cardunculus var. scolymus]|uniref:Armadillo-like helical n=1 Tax=Cynara cardunculus var. scolymus TaxID=59895 RepID=A0A103XBG6_CYNCS|nr:Armadillo-like helical [Cynara cardunculus var. scolymus]